MFANLFDKVPAKRAGVPEDIVAVILYLVSKAGVSQFHTSLMEGLRQWTVIGYGWGKNTSCKRPRLSAPMFTIVHGTKRDIEHIESQM